MHLKITFFFSILHECLVNVSNWTVSEAKTPLSLLKKNYYLLQKELLEANAFSVYLYPVSDTIIRAHTQINS